MIDTSFGQILRKAVDATPGAVGGVLAARDGETVDYWTALEDDQWQLITAHFGILVSHIRKAFHTFHFGDIQYIHMDYQGLALLIQVVESDYYVLLALEPPAHIGAAKRTLELASAHLEREMR